MTNTKLYIKTAVTDFYGWSTMEYLWLFICSAAIALTSVIMGGGVIEFVSSVTGIIGAILVAKGRLSSYYWGFVATVLYAYVAYKYQLYGEAIMYTILFTPMQVIGGVIWARQLEVKGDRAEVIKKYLTTKQRWALGVGTLIAIALYAEFVSLLKGAAPGLDSATAILSILATYLMMKRYAEQWYVWIVVNVVAVTLWIQTALHHETQGWALLAMWVAFLLNSIFGAYQWRKLEKSK
ncbi:nicotinamide mononucleotide transporter [Erwinia phage Hena1]|jgi:nicotinamide mononucleotide transporter|uniref:Nicotinamide mononucleotide transporter n=1 Tax=Erwinia phage Hena1 TaxID=2678601 RepID=A0A6B9JBB7_9CAUD|nr:PnuC-like nicotinamide mononucleotide transport [Erwinia phage Hena1]QGZ16326.1 nicotinamide mononucleotide transporter [Erwinia phage Hena1]